ncbi:hypothetical protein ACFX2C_042642 [Malus domestica]
MRKPKSKKSRMQSKHSELQEVELLKSWIESQQPERGSNPTSLPALPLDARAGRLDSTRFSRYAGATRFDQLPISKKTKDALRQSKKYVQMSDIQRACLPHALCGRDVRGAAKTGSGKTLAFVIPIVEKLYRERWCPQDGVGSIVISPTREIASQTFDVLRLVGRHHSFSAALLIGGCCVRIAPNLMEQTQANPQEIYQMKMQEQNIKDTKILKRFLNSQCNWSTSSEQ